MDFKDKKVLLLGLGKEGMDNLLFFKGACKKLGVADEKENIELDGVTVHLGKNYLQHLDEYDVIVKSPGIPMEKVKGRKVTSQSDIFLQKNRDRVIGITGTKGKSTISSILNRCIKNSHLIGNVGYPVLSFMGKEGTFIYELSSFQLATVTTSPHIAIILNIYPDYLDNHKTFEEYVEAKKNITRFQTKEDILIYNAEDKEVLKIIKDSKAKKIPFYPEENKKNIATPLAPVYVLGKELGIDVEEGIKNFKPLPHRLEYVGKFNNADFYNDSAATIPEATIKAIKTIKDVDTLIVGGVNKGIDYTKLIKEIEISNIKNLIILKGGENIKANNVNIIPVKDMEEAVDVALKKTKSACILSPAASSFNLFADYKERGELFKKYLNEKGT